jgi:hypothetical protein
MQVGAFSTPDQPDWRWRIINYAGETVEESRRTFETIALAVNDGMRRLKQMAPDRSVPRSGYRSTSHLRGRVHTDRAS